jgi:hypothetical protein
MADFVTKYRLTFPQAVTEDGALWTHFGIAFQPAWVFVDDTGAVTMVPYELPRDQLEQRLDRLVGN